MSQAERDFSLYFLLKSIFLHIENWEENLLTKFELSLLRFFIFAKCLSSAGD